MRVKTVAKPLALASALMSLFFAPAPAGSGNSIGAETVCATGTCCPQTNSICNDGGTTEWQNRYHTTGSCTGGS